MKLLDKYNRISLITTILVIIITGVVYYFTISYILTDQVDKDLLVEENEIFDYVKANRQLPQIFKSEDLKITFKPAGKKPIQRQFININYWNEKDHDHESGRGLISSVMVNGINYRINIIESKVETEDLIQLIFLITLGIILILIVVLIVINRLVIRNLWLPFYDMLAQIKLFNLTDHDTINGLQTNIEEFKDMNQEISAMSTRVRQDYQELKSFIENASHELMTPIAVMNSKLDTLIQTSNLTEKQGALINDVYNTVGKLTRLNKAMLLLTKIENKLINDQEQVIVKVAVEDALSEFQEIFAGKQLTLHSQLEDVQTSTSKVVLDILLNNLLTNAVRHNLRGGDIFITLAGRELVISNTGKPVALDTQQIFQRFHKAPESEGSGLGLTLARQICENYGLNLTYSYTQTRHTFTVGF
ncbi:sensor histidine kinase [Mucilaginibacter sp. UYCu711]|uniref:sensor histidine kinase n=1 Tax=Mucilaginibacter sp. UYCu711 TaxID=3156339 RepID=UPI003D1B0617